MAAPNPTHERVKAQRQHHTDAILNSQAPKRIIVAGPGTGKTHFFKELLGKTKNNLTLTFINALVEDLSLALSGISEVKTLHGFARSIMASATQSDVKIFPKLPQVIRDDARLFKRADIDFDSLFHDMTISGEDLDFYRERKDSYRHYGFSDVIFAAVKYLEAHRSKIPKYDQIVVDEFQDFNRLELSLINLLSEVSPIVLAGDDDQALYEFKRASTEHIRKLNDRASGYEPHNLPFCLRCTRVIVDTVGDIVAASTRAGHLEGRIAKPYIYFDDPDKDVESIRNPKIAFARAQVSQIPWLIERSLREIAADTRRPFSVLVISPARIQLREIAKGLRSKGFRNIQYADAENREVELMDGLKLLLDDSENILGWRIAAKFCVPDEELGPALRRARDNPTVPLRKFIPLHYRSLIRRLRAYLRKLRDEEQLDQDAISELFNALGVDAIKFAIRQIRQGLESEDWDAGDPAIRKTPIKLSTIQGSKGLSDDYVFITHFDDQYYLDGTKDGKMQITDLSICKLLVALTRARRKVFLISTALNQRAKFLDWISQDRIQTIFDVSK